MVFVTNEQTILTLARVLKSSDQAIIVDQLLNWQQKKARINDPEAFHEGTWWVYMPIRAWQGQLSWISERTIQRYFRDLTEQGIVIVGNFNEDRFDQTNWYSLDYQALNQLIQEKGRK